MGQSDHFLRGSHNAICDICGFKYKANKLRQQWDGLRACAGPGTNNCHSPRHPQEFVKGKADRQAPPWTRPEGDDQFITPGPIDPDAL